MGIFDVEDTISKIDTNDVWINMGIEHSRRLIGIHESSGSSAFMHVMGSLVEDFCEKVDNKGKYNRVVRFMFHEGELKSILFESQNIKDGIEFLMSPWIQPTGISTCIEMLIVNSLSTKSLLGRIMASYEIKEEHSYYFRHLLIELSKKYLVPLTWTADCLKDF